MPMILLAVVAFVYAPTFNSGFLAYDDPWLIQQNPFYKPGTWHAPTAFFFDFSPDTRLALGAEYLPLRDLLVWIETRLFGINPGLMHVVSVGLYGTALLMLRATLRITLGRGWVAELSTLLFALHPVHVESVAWLAGQKDVLALCFITAALLLHARGTRVALRWVPLVVLAACLSKAMSVAVIGLLVAHDFWLRRPLKRPLYLATAVATLFALALHVYTGRIVHMLAEPPGGSPYASLITMGPVWLRYLTLSVLPVDLSITYWVPDASSWSGKAVAGYAFVLGTLLASVLTARHGQKLWSLAWAWFFVPLVPVSQLLAPLQNRMADRYAWLSVLAPCLLVSCAIAAGIQRAAKQARPAVIAIAVALCCTLAWLSFQRSVLFTDGILLFSSATLRDPENPKPTRLLAGALVAAGHEEQAMLAYRETLRRSHPRTGADYLGAVNGLASLLAKRGQLAEAEDVLNEARELYPRHPKLVRNLAKILRGTNREDEAEQLERTLQEGEDESDGPP